MNASPEGIRPALIEAYKRTLGRVILPTHAVNPNRRQSANYRRHHRVRIDLPMSYATTEEVIDLDALKATRPPTCFWLERVKTDKTQVVISATGKHNDKRATSKFHLGGGLLLTPREIWLMVILCLDD